MVSLLLSINFILFIRFRTLCDNICAKNKFQLHVKYVCWRRNLTPSSIENKSKNVKNSKMIHKRNYIIKYGWSNIKLYHKYLDDMDGCSSLYMNYFEHLIMNVIHWLNQQNKTFILWAIYDILQLNMDLLDIRFG